MALFTNLDAVSPPAYLSRLVFGYSSCILLVTMFVNFYELFTRVRSLIGDSGMLIVPFIFTGLAFAVILKTASQRAPEKKRWRWIVVGILCCLAGLLLPDPTIPVKRIHVSEYLLLSLVVRWTLSHRTSGLHLLGTSILLSVLFGVHDELLQGFHPLRTYGLRDMLVNSLAGCGGCLIWHGLDLFSRKDLLYKNQTTFSVILYYCWLILSVVALVVPLVSFRQEQMPLWTILPLCATLVCWSCLGKQKYPNHPLVAVSLTATAMLIYPVLNNATTLVFY
jgi:VanZ family protein